MTQQKKPPCQFCGKPIAVGKHNVCFSDDRCYRYWLGAKIQLDHGLEDKGTCFFVMLNPSTADECLSDQTIDRCKEFASKWGYRTLWICNLYAFRASDPSDLRKALDNKVNIVGYAINDDHIREAAKCAAKIVLAWGGSGIGTLGKPAFNKRVSEIVQLLRDADASEKLYLLCPPDLCCLTDGQPRHPKPQNLKQMPIETTECKRVRIGSEGTLTIAD